MADNGDELFSFLDSESPKDPDDQEWMPEEEPGARAEADSEQEQEYDGLAQSRRREIRILALIALSVGLFGAWWIGANLWQLSKAEPPGLTLSIRGPGAFAGITYLAGIRWLPADVEVGPRPRLLIGDRELTPLAAGAASVPVAVGQPVPLQVAVASETGRGRHRGEVLLRPVESESGAPELRIPVDIEVVGGIWSRSWSTARWGLIATAALVVLFYGFCLLVVPSPRGTLSVALDGDPRPEARVRLKPPWYSILRPWRRSWIPLQSLARRSGIGELARARGGLLFLGSTLPLLETSADRRGLVVERAPARGAGARERTDARFARIGSTALMVETRVYRIRHSTSPRGVRIRYSGS